MASATGVGLVGGGATWLSDTGSVTHATIVIMTNSSKKMRAWRSRYSLRRFLLMFFTSGRDTEPRMLPTVALSTYTQGNRETAQ